MVRVDIRIPRTPGRDIPLLDTTRQTIRRLDMTIPAIPVPAIRVPAIRVPATPARAIPARGILEVVSLRTKASDASCANWLVGLMPTATAWLTVGLLRARPELPSF